MRCLSALLLVTQVALSGCGGDGAPSNRIAPPGTLQLFTPLTDSNSPGRMSQTVSITFDAAQGSSNPDTQTATLTASAASPAYTWQVSYSPSVADWLQVSPASGAPDLSSGPQTLMFNVNAAGLAAGVYSATVTFSSAPSFRAPMTVTLFVG